METVNLDKIIWSLTQISNNQSAAFSLRDTWCVCVCVCVYVWKEKNK